LPRSEQSGVERPSACTAQWGSPRWIPSSWGAGLRGGRTPGDSVILALEVMKDIGLVVSGINTGPTWAATCCSRDCGAALQATSTAFRQWLSPFRPAGLPLRSGGQGGQPPRTKGLRQRHGANSAERQRAERAQHEIKGIELTRVGKGGFSTAITMGATEAGQVQDQHWQAWWSGDVGTDIHAVENARISITLCRVN